MAQGKSDGTVYIDTKIDTSGIGRGINETKSKLNSVSDSVKRFGDNLRKAFSGVKTTGATSGFTNYENQIKKLELQLEKLIEKQIRFVETGGNVKSRTFAGMEYDIAQVSARLEELRAKKSAFDSLSASEQNAVSNSQMLANTISLIRSSFANLIPNLKTATKNILTFAGRGILNGIKKIGSQVKKLASSLLSVGKSAKKSNRSLLMMLGSSLLFSTVFRAISALINSFKEGIQNLAQYSDEANSSMSALKTATSQLKNSLATAFMPLITIVTPALVSFINMLNKALTAIGAFFSALSGKSTFTKAVAVQQDYASSLDKTAKSADKAKKAQNSYTSSLDELNIISKNDDESQLGGGAGGVNPSAMFEEMPISDSIKAFADKIKEIFNNIKEFIKNEDWDGLGEYLAEGINIALQYLYDALNWENVEEKVMPFITAFTQTFNSLVDNIDWDLLGRTIGTGINTLVNIVYELITGIDWGNLGVSIGESINGLFSEIDWTKAGETLGEAINGLLDLINGFLEETDWKQIGNAIIDFIFGGIKELDVTALAQGISDLVLFIPKAIIGALQGTDWGEVANVLWQKIKDLFIGIKWGEIASTVSEGIGSLLGAAIKFAITFLSNIWNDFMDAWDGLIEWWKEVAFEDGQFTIQGLLDGIWEVVKNIGKWLLENIVNPFIDGFKEAFGIHSPSTVMSELGEFIIQGLINGIKSLIIDLKLSVNKIKDSVVNIFKKVKESVIGIWDGIVKGIKSAVNGIIGFINGMISGVTKGINAIIGLLNNLSFDIPDWVPEFGGKTFGFDIPKITPPKIPYLATGAVIPPNAPFMAMLGDQTNGRNLEAPEDLIRQIVREEAGVNTQILDALLQIAKNTRETADKDLIIGDREIAKANLRGQNSMGFSLITEG